MFGRKLFFKQVWDRLHVERAWSKAKKGKNREEVEGDHDSFEHDAENNDSENEEVDEMVKAAAQWLTRRDEASSTSTQPSRAKATRGRGLPSRKRQGAMQTQGE